MKVLPRLSYAAWMRTTASEDGMIRVRAYCDELARRLKEAGIEEAIIQANMDLLVYGTSAIKVHPNGKIEALSPDFEEVNQPQLYDGWDVIPVDLDPE